ncbi:MAG TPA: hypothetical protein IAC03_05425 [Candidatus Coprenecus pullistercoris]|nr:hypothetical protein [Candidatus Coprenecus pullistercoris]
METTVKERLIRYISYKGLSKNKFETACGFGSRYVSNIRVSIPPDKIKIISLNFPDLNTGWLLTGEGEMLRENSPKTSDSASLPETGYSGSETLLMRIIEGKDAKIEELSRRIGELEAENRLLKERHFRNMDVSNAGSAVAG